jgi:hypothetical protein
MTGKPLYDHVRKYISAIFQKRLTEEGFFSDNGINWYRISQDEVIHGIYFYSSYPMLPAALNIGYGCHPMFIAPHISSDPYLYASLGDEVIYPGKLNMKAANTIFSMDAMVLCPDDEFKGLDLLDAVLSDIDGHNTASDCYGLHKQWKDSQIQNQTFMNVSTAFLDEVVYFDDKELYPLCAQWIRSRTESLLAAQETSKLWEGHETELKELEILAPAILQGKRQEHLQLLAQREKAIRKKLQTILENKI